MNRSYVIIGTVEPDDKPRSIIVGHYKNYPEASNALLEISEAIDLIAEAFPDSEEWEDFMAKYDDILGGEAVYADRFEFDIMEVPPIEPSEDPRIHESGFVHTKDGKKVFLSNIVNSILIAMTADINAGKIPDSWDGIELRWWLSDVANDQQANRTGLHYERYKRYKNTRVIDNLE